MTNLITLLFPLLTFQPVAHADSTADAYPRMCLNYIQSSRTTGGSGRQDRALCATMTSRYKAFCVGYMILNRVDNLRARGWLWAPTYDLLRTCSQVQNQHQYFAVHALITDYGHHLLKRDVLVGLRANTDEKSDCFRLMLRTTHRSSDLESCVD